MDDLVAKPTGQTRHGVQEWCLPDGRLFEVDFAEQDLSPMILTRAAEMAYHRGGQTHPISDYDTRLARQEITGEEDRVLALTARIQALETSLAEAEGRVIADVVAWLRHQHVEIRAMRSPVRNLDDIATALETGEWKK